METIKRTLMLLRPFGIKAGPGKTGGILKLQSSEDGISLALKTDCLGEGDHCLYLFPANGREFYAGSVTGGVLNASLSGIILENISGAAVVRRNRTNYDFVLRSTGPDWQSLIERFRLARAPRPSGTTDDSFPHPEAAVENTDTPESVSAEPAPHAEAEAETLDENLKDIIKKMYVRQDDEERLPVAGEKDGEERLPVAGEEDEGERSPGVEEAGSGACPHALRENKINPFPFVFPNSEWVKISYPGPSGWWHYISGKIYEGGVVAAEALGVPGEYGIAPPVWLEGFGTYLRCSAEDARGYWLMFQDAETGEVLDMGLSPHGA